MFQSELFGGDGDRIEEAEAQRLLSFGVVSRRTHHREPVLHLSRRS